MPGAANRLKWSEQRDNKRSSNTSSNRSGELKASAMPWIGSWLKSSPAVPKGRSRSAMTTSLSSVSAMAKAVLWQTVLEPAPPLAPTKAMSWPTGPASGSV